MRVALAQTDMVWEDKKASIQKAEKMVSEAAKSKTDIIIFPEMSFTGFSMNLEKIGEKRDCSETVSCMSTLSKKYNIALGFGWASLPDKKGGKGKNIFSVTDREGKLIAEYEKIHPFTYGGESRVYEGGEKLVSFSFQAAAKKSDVMFVIAQWPETRSIHWQTLLRARAIETQSYIVGVNSFGVRDGLGYSGDSMAIDSIGNILGQLSGREGMLICDIDDRAWELRNKFAIGKDRRENLYYRLLEE